MLAAGRQKLGGGLLRDAAILVTGNTGAQVLSILLTPIITRMFSVDNYGVMTTFTAVALTVAVFGCGSYDQAINVPKEDSKAWSLFFLCILLATVFSGAIFIVTAVFEQRITQLIFKTDHNALVFLLPLTVFARCIYLPMLFWMIRTRSYKVLSWAAFLSTACNQGAKALGGWILGDKLSPLIVGSFLSNFIPCFLLGTYIYRTTDKDVIRLPKKSELIKVVFEYKNFPLYATWVEALLNLGRSITIFLLAFVYDNRVVGSYGLAHNVLRLPVFIIADSIRQVCLPRIAALINDNMPVRGLIFKSLLGLAVVAVLPLAVIMVFGPQLFSIVFGQNWGEAGVYARIISPWVFMMIFVPPISAVLTITQKQRFRLAFYIALTGFQAVTVLIAKSLEIEIHMLLMLLSVGSCAIYVGKIIYGLTLVMRYERSIESV